MYHRYIYNKKGIIDKDVKYAHIYAIIKTGANRDPVLKRGLAHFVEHMSLSYDKYRRSDLLKSRSQKLILPDNYLFSGTTDYDYTILKIMTDDNLSRTKEALILLREMTKITFYKKYFFEAVRNEILLEYEHRYDNMIQTQKAVSVLTNNDINYLPIGTIDSIKSVCFEDVIDYVKRTYMPENISLFVVSSFSNDEISAIIDEEWEGNFENSLNYKFFKLNSSNSNNSYYVYFKKRNLNFSSEEKAILFLFFHLLTQVIIEECRILGLKCENFRIVNKNICDKNGFIGLKFKLPYADSEKSAELALKVYNRINQSTLDRKLIKNTFKILTKEFNKKLKKTFDDIFYFSLYNFVYNESTAKPEKQDLHYLKKDILNGNAFKKLYNMFESTLYFFVKGN